jgi:hypothetical protein
MKGVEAESYTATCNPFKNVSGTTLRGDFKVSKVGPSYSGRINAEIRTLSCNFDAAGILYKNNVVSSDPSTFFWNGTISNNQPGAFFASRSWKINDFSNAASVVVYTSSSVTPSFCCNLLWNSDGSIASCSSFNSVPISNNDPTVFLKAEVIIENDIAPTNGIIGEVILSNVQGNCLPYAGTMIAHLHSKPCSVAFGSDPYQDPITGEDLIYTMDVSNGFQGGKAFFDQRSWTVP